MTRQRIANLLFLMFIALWVGLMAVFHLSDPAVGIIADQCLLLSMNRLISFPAAIFGTYSVVVGLRTLREGKYPPPNVIVPFPSIAHAKLKASSAGLACIFLGVFSFLGPLLIFTVAVCAN